VHIKTLRGWALVSFFIILALAAWRAFSLYRSHSSAKKEVGETTTEVEGGDYVNIA
jgi:hypothetical protein